MAKKLKPIDAVVLRTARSQERLSPVTEMSGIGEFTPKKIREHLRELTAIVADMTMEIKTMQEGK
jgi:hypothetical protein